MRQEPSHTYGDFSLRFVTILSELTQGGRAIWVRRAVEPEYVFCFVNGEKIDLEPLGPDGEVVLPSAQPSGIHIRCRNLQFLWLEGVPGWLPLLELIRSAPIDDETFAAQYSEGLRVVLDDLSRLTEGLPDIE